MYGTLRTFDRLHVYTKGLTIEDKEKYENDVVINGRLYKASYRKTPLGREIADMSVTVERRYKIDYIPCIVWGRNARYICTRDTYKNLKIYGRIQSHEEKCEISVSKLSGYSEQNN